MDVRIGRYEEVHKAFMNSALTAIRIYSMNSLNCHNCTAGHTHDFSQSCENEERRNSETILPVSLETTAHGLTDFKFLGGGKGVRIAYLDHLFPSQISPGETDENCFKGQWEVMSL